MQDIAENVIKIIDDFKTSDVVIVTKPLYCISELSKIIAQFKDEKRTFAIFYVKNPDGYIVVREVEESYIKKSKHTGIDQVISDYVTIDKKPRGIVSSCPDGRLIKFWFKGKEIFNNPHMET